MNTDKTIRDKFSTQDLNGYPIWYYKQLEEIEVDDVIYNLLKETFVVEINNKKIEITFGKNRKGEIGTHQWSNEGLDYTSFETIRRAFTEGKWFRITDKDTTDKFKERYRIEKEKKDADNKRRFMIEIISKIIEKRANSQQHEDALKMELLSKTDEELEELFQSIKWR